MKLSRSIIFWTIAAVVFLGIVVALNQKDYFLKAPTSFPPPYPEANASGDPILAVFEGRIPCAAAECEQMKLGLVLYHNAETKAPTTYWLGLIAVGKGNNRVVTQGSWTIRHGVADYPEAEVYELDANTDLDHRYYWRVNEDILLPLDEKMSPRVGNAAWGFMLSRYAGPYGPRTDEK